MKRLSSYAKQPSVHPNVLPLGRVTRAAIDLQRAIVRDAYIKQAVANYRCACGASSSAAGDGADASFPLPNVDRTDLYGQIDAGNPAHAR